MAERVHWGHETELATAGGPVSGQPMPAELVRALVRIKRAAANANGRLGALDPARAEAIASAADEVLGGRWDDQFPVDVMQTGSGTSTNMNVNEVLAALASARSALPVHPNDHVNASQSSNDVVPSALHVALLAAIARELRPALVDLAATLRSRSGDLADVVKPGRTHLMDAVPMTLGQELGGWARMVELGVQRLDAAAIHLEELPLGGTAVGTGLACPPGFAPAVIAEVAAELDLPLREAQDHFEAQAGRDAVVGCSAALRSVALSLNKIAADLRWLSSGPAGGLAEIRLPRLQAGSSIMPGKVNPVVPEIVQQVAARVVGNDATVAFATTIGQLDLLVAVPVLALAGLESVRLLSAAARLLDQRCVRGLEADADRCRRLAEESPAVVTALNARIGYERGAALVADAQRSGRSLREVAVASGAVTPEEADDLLDVDRLAHPWSDR